MKHGNAMHAVMQHIDFSVCSDSNAVAAEIDRLVSVGFICAQQAQLVRPEKVAAFFASKLGQTLRSSQNVLREFKFSILDDAGRYVSGICDEQILLQGVVDCALVEDDGITVVDFKTDRVSIDTLSTVTERYRMQVEIYAQALCRIFELPVKAKALYFFAIDDFVWL